MVEDRYEELNNDNDDYKAREESRKKTSSDIMNEIEKLKDALMSHKNYVKC